MMKAEERARAVVTHFQGDEYWIDTEAAIVEVAAAITAAVEEEREACAQTLVVSAKTWPTRSAEYRLLSGVAAAIRRRKT